MRRLQFPRLLKEALASLILLAVIGPPGMAQRMDTDTLLQKPAKKPVKKAPGALTPVSEMKDAATPAPEDIRIPTGFKPLTASVSKTLYLPPAMYGQWTVTGTIKETNISDLAPAVNDIWILQREGDAVTITNPSNGASAAINVDAVDGDTATFHRYGESEKINRFETVTLTVKGDTLYGRNLRKEEVLRKGKVVRVNYALFELRGTRISGASAVFKPEVRDAGPDIEIEDVRRGSR